MSVPGTAIEAAARAWAIHREHDGCFERVDAWEALEAWEREAHPDERPESDYEDCATYREFATAALSAAYPLMVARAKAEAWDEGYGDCLMYHRSEGTAGTQDNPYRAATIEEKDS